MNRRLTVALVGSLLIVISGCLGFSSPGTQSTTESPQSVQPTASPQTSSPPCNESTVPYNLSAPSKPDNLTKKTAVTLVKAFDNRYAQAEANHDYDNVTVTITGQRVTTERIPSGFKITITTKVQISGTDDGKDINAKWGYPTTYQVTDRKFVRDEATLYCW
jgi:hypothetical protein